MGLLAELEADYAAMKKERDELKEELYRRRAEVERLREAKEYAVQVWDTRMKQISDQMDRTQAKLKEAEARAETLQERVAALEELLLMKVTDLRPDGKTILDFFRVWLDQERDGRREAEARAERAEAANKRYLSDFRIQNDHIVKQQDTIEDLQAVAEAAQAWRSRIGHGTGGVFSAAQKLIQALDAAKRPAPRNPEGEEDPR